MTLVQKLKYKTYPKYKDSGLEWLGRIPDEWDAVKMKYLFRDVSIKNKPEETLLSVTQDKGVVPRDWVENRMVMPSGSLETFKFIEKGDFSISLRSFEGGLEYCHHDGIISPAYTVLKKREDLIADYYKYFFKSKSFISEMQTSIVGIREGKNISYSILSYSLIPLPEKDEQTAIANFLDNKTTKIDQAIAQKEKLIELLKERKQILIQNAVTGKVVWSKKEQKFVPLALSEVEGKDSGVEWIGEIPEGWEVIKIKRIAKKITDGEHISPMFTDEGMPFLSAKDIREGYIEFPNNKFVKIRDGKKFRERCNPERGDILLVSRGATIGRVSKVETDIEFCLLGSVILIKPNSKIDTDFLSKALGNKVLQDTFLNTSHHSAQQAIYIVKVAEVYIAFPPKEEQKAIVSNIETQSTKIDKAIALQQNQIEKLKEYKSVLIDNTVTGKIRVT